MNRRRMIVAAIVLIGLVVLAAIVLRDGERAPAPTPPQGSVAGRLPDGYCAVAPDAPGERGAAARRLAQRWSDNGRLVFVALPCGADDRESLADGARVFVRILTDRATGEPLVFENAEALAAWAQADRERGTDGEAIAGTGNVSFPPVETGRYVLMPSTLDLPATDSLPERRATAVDGYMMSGDLPVHVRFERETTGQGVLSELLGDAHTLMESLDVRLGE